MTSLFQVPVPIGGKEGFRGFGPLGLENVDILSTAPLIFSTIISNIIGFLTVVAGLWFIFNVIIAGYGWLAAGGDKQKLGEAQAKLTSSVIGLTVVVVGIFFVRLIATLLGIKLILDPLGAILELMPK